RERLLERIESGVAELAVGGVLPAVVDEAPGAGDVSAPRIVVVAERHLGFALGALDEMLGREAQVPARGRTFDDDLAFAIDDAKGEAVARALLELVGHDRDGDQRPVARLSRRDFPEAPRGLEPASDRGQERAPLDARRQVAAELEPRSLEERQRLRAP